MRMGAAAAVLLIVGSSCGGHDPAGPSTDGSGEPGTRWQDLYASYFGTTGQASCSQKPGACHGVASDLGVSTSGFVCGMTSDSCWQGVTHSIDTHQALVPPGVTDATQTILWAALYKGAPLGAAANNMPQNLSYTFSASDLARIRAWIEKGAPND